ncbi:MAG: MFS transporter, partial [Prevotella sp.]|nr:MFS transporter [Prevotella sp.]
MQIKISPFIPITLGMLTAFGPFVTDVYLPAMPELADYYRTSAVAVGASLTAGMLGLASGQILIGPLSDKFGRKKLLLLSMTLFVIASLLCVFSPNIQLFNLFRFFQGMSGAGGVVLSRSIATDMFRDKQLADFLA